MGGGISGVKQRKGGMYVGFNVSFRDLVKQYTEHIRNADFSTEAITKNDFNSKYSTITPKILQSARNHVLWAAKKLTVHVSTRYGPHIK